MPLVAPVVSRGPQNTGDTALVGGTSLAPMSIRLFADFQRYLDPTETPFTSSLKTGKAVNQKKVEWGSSFLAPHTSTLGVALTDTTGTSVSTVANDGAKFMVTDVIKIDDERMWITAITGDVLTVKRGVGGSTAATHLINATIDILGPAAQENAETPIAPIAKGGLEYNLPQLFDYGLHLSDRENNTPDYEFQRGSKYESYLQKLMKEAAIDFEKSAILGRRREEVAMTGATATPSMMGGLDFFTDVVTNLSGAPLTELALMDAMQASWQSVGPDNMAKNLYVGGFGKRAISSLFNATRLADVRDTETKLLWRSVETDFGTIRFVLSRYIPNGTLFLVNNDDITIHPYANGAWKEVRLPSSGPFIKGRFTGDYTIVFRGNAARSKIINFSTNAADYPNM